MRIVCDNDKCTGCLACVVACMDHHFPDGEEDAVSGRIYKKKILPSGYTKYETESCRHCDPAPCIDGCPAGAISRSDDGWVVVEKSLCIGCGYCAGVCPFGIPQFGADGTMVKCDGCDGSPACVKVCPNGALSVKA